MKRKIVSGAITCIVLAIVFGGCVYHKNDQVNPEPPDNGCDTSNVKYSVDIKAILDANCKSCHNGANSPSGIDLYNHTVISGLALDGNFTYGTLLSAVKHEGGAPQMPKGGSMLSDCDINTIAAWVHAGAPDN